MEALTTAAAAVCGAALASVLACVPGLHIYNLLGLVVIGVQTCAGRGLEVPPGLLIPLAVGMVTAYAMLNTIPSVLLAAPDESAFFTVLPGQKYVMAGRGYAATWITAAGGIGGLLLVLFVAAPLAPRCLPLCRRVLGPHLHWILWCVICYLLMSEWPKEGARGQGGWGRFLAAWRPLGAGLLTFALSGLLGFLLLYRSPVAPGAGFQNLMPAFVGLFTLPWLLANLASRVQPPPQRTDAALRLDPGTAVRGVLAGGAGGAFAAFFPVVTGGVGGFLAGQAAAVRNDRVFLVSQGASKLVYYVGGLLLFFMPGASMTRGGGAWMLRTLLVPVGRHDYYMALAAVALAGATSVLLLGPLARAVLVVMDRWGYRRVSIGVLVTIVLLVCVVTGLPGLAVAAVAGAIGLIPVLWGARRMNCLGVILLPIACNMSGIGSAVAARLGLL